MEIQPLSQMLETLLVLLARGPARFDSESEEVSSQVCLAEAPLEMGPDVQVDVHALHSEYEGRYARAVAGVCEHLGPPFFQGSSEAPSFPADLYAEQASCWHRPLGMVYLALAQSPQHLRLLAGARPRLLSYRPPIPTQAPPANEP